MGIIKGAGKKKYEGFSPSEQAVIYWMAKGLSNREISEVLCVHLKTVKWHIGHVYYKLNINNFRKRVKNGRFYDFETLPGFENFKDVVTIGQKLAAGMTRQQIADEEAEVVEARKRKQRANIFEKAAQNEHLGLPSGNN